MSLDTADQVDSMRSFLVWQQMSQRLTSRAAATLYFILAAAMNFWHLGSIKGFIFDEVYYAKDGHSLLLHGVELNAQGGSEFIVHPPVGKWLIAIGIKIFGFHEFGWRASAAFIGALSVSLVFLFARSLFQSDLAGHLAAALTLLDGMHLVMSRTGLLDIFLMFFTLLAAYAIFIRKHWLAAISLGLASATKWSGLYYIVAFAAWALYLDYQSEKAIDNLTPIKSTATAWLPLRFLQYGLIAPLTYVLSWLGWFLSGNGWDRNWSKKNWGVLPAALRNFWHYHSEILNFHQNLHDRHPYMSNPWSWLIQGRPTSFFYSTPKGCGTSGCSKEVLALGTPFLWWSALFAIFVLIGYLVARRDQIAAFILLLIGAGWLPWFTFQKRTMFTFYTIAFEPFIILAIVFCCHKAIVSAPSAHSRRVRLRLLLAFMVAILACFIYFAPLYFGITIPYHNWLAKMWFPSWI